jgi:hypothetical protein
MVSADFGCCDAKDNGVSENISVKAISYHFILPKKRSQRKFAMKEQEKSH